MPVLYDFSVVTHCEGMTPNLDDFNNWNSFAPLISAVSLLEIE